MKYIKNKKYSKLLIVLLIVIGISSSFLMFKSYGYQDKELPKVRLKNETKNKTFAIMLEDNYQDGNYTEYESDTFPTDGYTFNGEKSKCTDTNGNIVKDVLSYDSENKLITLNTNKTVYCYIYYDRTMFFGSGTEKSPYQINHIEDLVRLSNSVNNGDSYSGKYFELTKSLDFKEKDSYENSERTDFGDINGVSETETLINELTNQDGTGFKPIGMDLATVHTKYFGGVFDGKENQISNLYINSITETKTAIGLFGNVVNGTIKNLTLDKNSIVKSKLNNAVGSIIGNVIGSTVENCHSEATAITDVVSWPTGGIIGLIYGSTTIKNCSYGGQVRGGSATGGIVGSADYGTLLFEGCINNGKITNFTARTGGIIGYINTTITEVTIRNSHNNGEINENHSQTSVKVGGIVGRNDSILNIDNVSNNTNIVNNVNLDNSNITNHIGGIIGFNNGKLMMSNAVNNNEIKVDVNQDIKMYLGGLIGGNNKKFEIDNCVNKGNVINSNDNSTNTIAIGGIIGDITMDSTNLSTMTNSHNEGTLSGGIVAGGAVGYQRGGAKVIINNFYNVGNITGAVNSSHVGGVVGYNNASVSFVLNAYNTGNLVSGYDASGILGTTNYAGTTKIINAFNIGNITSLNDVANGIAIGRATGENILETYNVYNIGTLNGATNQYGIGYYGGTVVNNNLYSYYANDDGITGSNRANVGEGMLLNNIKNQTFVDTLNDNMYKIDLASIDENLKGYKLNGWVLGLDGYPIFAKNIKDLSGQGNDGISFAASWTDEGITTSTSDKIGYVYGGLENHDFGEDLTFVIRLKFNDIEKEQYILSNQEGAGGAFIYKNQYIRLTLYGQDLPTPGYVAAPYSKTKLNADTWYTIVGTYDSKVGKEILYINGGEEASQALTGRIKPSVVFMGIGQNPYKNLSTITSPTYATYSDVLIFDRALTSDEIKENYNDVPNPVNKDELLLWYKFN